MIVLPENGLVFSERQAAALAATLLNIDPPSRTEKWVHIANDAAVSAARLWFAAGVLSDLTRINPKIRRNQDFFAALPMLTELVQKLAVTRPELPLSGFRVFARHADIPAEMTCSRGRFHAAVAYAVHPADPNHFIPIADFHSYLLQEKRAEFLRIAGALGAKNVRQTQREHSVKSTRANVTAEAPAAVSANAQAAVAAGSASKSLFNLSASFQSTARPDQLPENLRWYHQEPLWQAMAETRINNKAMSFELTFRYQQDFQVNASLVAGIERLGLSIGGSFETMLEVEQECIVEFHPA